MSDQNLNTDNSFSADSPSGSQPLPIASQIIGQSYLSHVQDNSAVGGKKPANDTTGTLTELAQRFSSEQDSEQKQRENKMDAFFREAEAERQELKAASKNVESNENQPGLPNPVFGQQEQPTPQTIVGSEFPANEIPQTAMGEPPAFSDDEFVAEQPPVFNADQHVSEPIAPAAPQTLDPPQWTPEVTTAPIAPSFNSATGEADLSAASENIVQQNDFYAPEAVENDMELDQPKLPSTSPFAAPSFGNSLPYAQPPAQATFESQPAVSQEPMEISEPAPAAQFAPADPTTTAEVAAMDQAVDTNFRTQQMTPEATNQETPDPLNLPEAPGWTAAIASATAGVMGAAGIAGAKFASGSPDDASDQLLPPENAGPNAAFVPNEVADENDAMSDHDHAAGVYQQLKQQMQDEEDVHQARFTAPTYQLSHDSDALLEEDIIASDNLNKGDTNGDDANFQDFSVADQQGNFAQHDVADQQNFAQQDSFVQPAFPENIDQSTAFAAEPADHSIPTQPDSNVPPVQSGVVEPAVVEPAAVEPAFVDPNLVVPVVEQSSAVEPAADQPAAEPHDAKDDRLAAMQKAQKIKADRAKALAELEPEPARPYGSNSTAPPAEGSNQENQDTASLASQGPSTTCDPSQIDAALDQVAASSNTQPANSQRPFPLNLFHQHLFENLRSGVVYVDHQRRVRFWSKGAEAMTGIASEAVIDRALYPQTYNLRSDDGTGVTLGNCPIVKCLEQMEHLSFDYRMLNAAGQEVKIELSVTPVVDQDRYVNGVILVFDDHSAEIDLQRQLKDLYEFSVLDPLTQVANRAEFERVLEEYVRAFNSSDDFNCSIIICDIDYFKSINDNFGHSIGDQALVAFADMLRTYVRSQDLVARYGGEEFVILCADCDTNSALHRAEQIRMALFKTQQPMLDGKAISASFGVSELRSGDTAMEFFVRADTALLKAKEMGRNRVVIADQRDAIRNVATGNTETSATGMQWQKQRRDHTALVCMEFKTATPVPVLVEKLRGFIIDKDAALQRVDQEFLSMEVDFESPEDYSRKGSFTMNIEFKDGDEKLDSDSRNATYVRVSIFPGRKKKWFSTNHTDVAPHLLAELRSYLMINDDASKLSIDMATEDVRGKSKDNA